MRFEFDVEIDRPVEDVFAYVTNVENLPRWQDATQSAERDGNVIRQRMSFVGRTLDLKLQVTAEEPNRRFDLETLGGPVSFTIRHTFEPTNGGTRIHVAGRGDAGTLFRLAAPVLAKRVEREARADFATLKEILESG